MNKCIYIIQYYFQKYNYIIIKNIYINNYLTINLLNLL